MDLWERCLHAIQVGDANVERAAREVRAASRGEEEGDEAMTRRYHDTVLSGKLRQVVCR